MQPLLICSVILLPLLAGAAIPLFRFRSDRARSIYVEAVVLINSVLTALLILNADGKVHTLYTLMDRLDIAFRLDGPGCLFAGLVAFLWPLATLYAFEYMESESRPDAFFAFYTMSMGITIAIAAAANLATLYMFYECLTLVTLPLVSHKKDDASIKAAETYVTFSITGAAMAFVGLIFLLNYGTGAPFTLGGTLNPERIQGSEDVLRWVFLLAFVGFGTKAAIFPMYSWLPKVSVAPTPVTALLHAVAVVNAGTFAVLRLIYYSYGTELLRGSLPQTLALLLACFTLLLAAVKAVREPHLKRRLAYSTVSNLSYMLTGLCLMTPSGMTGGLAHLIMHSVIKICLFWCAGAILVRTRCAYVQDLRGFHRQMPATTAAFAIGAVALSGIPPLCGFTSKWILLSAARETGGWLGIIAMTALIIASLMSAVYALTPAFVMYFRPLNSGLRALEGRRLDPGWRMKFPLFVMVILMLVLGVAASPLLGWIRGIATPV